MALTPLIVIQARLGSKRLPSKILLPLGDKPVLQHVVERCQRTGYPVVVACPDKDICSLANYARMTLGDHGNEGDVLGRFARTANNCVADCIVRITADCPLVDPQLIEAAVQAIRDGADYAGNTVERHWPRGCDVECFTTELLLQTHQNATDPYDREHVTPWMQRWAASPVALEAPSRPLDAPNSWRWCLDTPRDAKWLTGLFTQYGDPSLEQAAAYSRMHPPPLD